MNSFWSEPEYQINAEDESRRLQSLLRESVRVLFLLAIAAWISYSFFTNSNVPVSRFRLSALLPKAPDGWRQSLTSGDNPSSVSLNWSEKDLTSVSRRTYRQAGKDVSVEIWDWGGSYPYHMPFDIPGWMSGDEVRVGAETGRLRYNPDNREGRLRVRYLERFYIVVEGDGVERHEFDAWYRRVDLAGLRRELAELRGAASSR